MKKVYYGEAGDEDGKKEENNKSEEDYKKRKRNRKLEKDNDEDRKAGKAKYLRGIRTKKCNKAERGEEEKEMKKE